MEVEAEEGIRPALTMVTLLGKKITLKNCPNPRPRAQEHQVAVHQWYRLLRQKRLSALTQGFNGWGCVNWQLERACFETG